jgi:cardiolipin synthase
LLSDYDRTIDRIVGDIAEAKNHVHLLYYIFADDATGRKVAAALTAAAKRGVRCRMLVDALGSRGFRKRLGPELRAAGVEVHELLPPRWFRWDAARKDLRNHRKIVVIDGRIGYVGSQNIVDAKFKEGITYEELVARVTGPAVVQLQGVFLADRYFETDNVLHRPELFPEFAPARGSAAQMLPSGPGYAQANNRRLFVALIYAAHSRVVITTPYFIPDDTLLEAMKTAVQRGVEVHLVVSRKADQLLVGLAQKSYYGELLAGGVKIHLYREKFLHAKFFTIDDTIAVIGSSNMDLRSFQLNAEISLIVYDPRVAGELRTLQERYFAAADLLTPEEWRDRPFLARTTQNIARLVDSVL